MQSITVTKISVELCHRNQIKLIVDLTAFEKLTPTWNLIWSGSYVPHPDPTRTDSQPNAQPTQDEAVVWVIRSFAIEVEDMKYYSTAIDD
jgi:hypothetical protein